MKKKEIIEVLDSDGNLIGQDDMPHSNPNEISADGTTDHNAAIGHQHFAHDFLGRFGFNMYNESEGADDSGSTDELLKEIAELCFEYRKGILEEIHFDPNKFGDYNVLSQKEFDDLTPEESKSSFEFAKKIVSLLHGKSKKKEEPTLTESEISKMIEDVITKRDDDKSIVKKNDNDILDSKVKDKIKSLLSTLSDTDKSELIKHLKN